MGNIKNKKPARLNILARTTRIKKGIAQKKVSKLLGYKSAQLYSNFERGLCSIPLNRITKLQRALGLPAAALRNVLIADYTDRVSQALK